MDVPREQGEYSPCGSGKRTRGAAVLLAIALAAGLARPQAGQPGSLEGRLTDSYSHPLAAATVVLKNAQTGTAERTVTTKSGSYHFAELTPGIYTLEVEDSGRGAGQVPGIVIAAGYASHVQTAVVLSSRPVLLADAEPRTLPVSGGQPKANPPRLAIGGPVSPLPEIVAHVEPAVTVLTGPANAAPEPAAATPSALMSSQVAEIARGGALLAGIASSALRSAFLQAALQPGIMAEARRPDPIQPAVTTTISGEQLQALPLNGRHWEDFVVDAPAVTTTIANEEQAVPGAGRRIADGVSLEGASANLAFGGTGPGRARASSVTGAGGNEAAIQEVQVASNATEPRSDVHTRSGLSLGAGLHGQAFLYDRQNLWDAKNPFTQWLKETTAATSATVPVFTAVPWSPGDRRETFGIGAGGALQRKRLAWFAAFDGDLRDNPGVSTVRHPENFFAQPSNDEMQVLSARLALSSSNPVAEGLAAYSPMLESLAGLLGPAARTSKQGNGFVRLDWNTAERHKFTLEGTGATSDAPGGGMTRASETYGTHSFGSSRAGSEWILGRWQAFLTPNLLSVAQGSMGRQVLDRPAETPSAFEQTLNDSAWGQLPQMVVDSRYGFTIGNPARFGPGNYPDEKLYEAQENLDWVRGSLLVRGGFELRHNADATSLLRNHAGTFHYTHIEDFASDALAFQKFGLGNDPANPHNCDQRGKAWRDPSGQLHGLGTLPCYSYYTQTLGPTDWHLETDDWAGFGTVQWQPAHTFVLSAGLRWERQDMPPPIALVNNPDLPLTRKLPSLGNDLAPRLSAAWGVPESHWPVLRLGYGLYFGRTPNSVLETALTETGSLNGDLTLFIRPMDGYNPFSGTSSAPMFPYVLQGDPGTIEKPGAVELAPTFRNGEIHQAIAAVEETLPGRILVSAAAMASLGRRLPVTVDTNIDPAINPKTVTYSVIDASGKGPIKTPRITVPFFAAWPSATGATGRLNDGYQQISELLSMANSTYEAATLRISRNGRHGLSFHARYTYAHAMDWNPNESTQVAGPSVLDPNDFRQEYGTSNLDVRHSLSTMAIWEAPWKAHGVAGSLVNGWTLSGLGQFHSGLPYTMRTAGSIPEEFTTTSTAIVGLGPGMNGYGGDERVYGVGRNTYRYPSTWKADVRVGKRFRMSHKQELELMGESFNLFNHQNVTEIETVGYSIEPGTIYGSFPTLNFLTGLKTGQTEFGQPLNINATDFYRERQIDFGLRYRF
ncbi:MAG TPA: carboxypeptidase-like regulatory domain-containing protein [Terracidiphilus sp.]|nr:carboxypeptidase-like regulatory domain-containing protein [Terracidiphilus sp.]